MAAYAERWIGVGDGDGVVEGGAGCHEGGGGEGLGLVKFCDGAIDAGSEPEVVGVDDESGRHRNIVQIGVVIEGRATRKRNAKENTGVLLFDKLRVSRTNFLYFCSIREPA